MTDHIQTLTNIHQRLAEITQLMASVDATGDQLLLIAKQIEWPVLVDEFDSIVWRYRNEVYKYARRIIRNLRRPYMLYHDCVALRVHMECLKCAIEESPSLLDQAGVSLNEAYEKVVRQESVRDQWLPDDLAKNPYPTLDLLFQAVDEKLRLGKKLEAERHIDFIDGRRAYVGTPRKFSWVVWCGDPASPERYGYGFAVNERLIFGGDMPNQHGHCVLWKEDGRMLVGYHTDSFRELSEEET